MYWSYIVDNAFRFKLNRLNDCRWTVHRRSWRFRQDLTDLQGQTVVATFQSLRAVARNAQLTINGQARDKDWVQVVLVSAMVNWAQQRMRCNRTTFPGSPGRFICRYLLKLFSFML